MIEVKPTCYSGWSDHPTYIVRSYDDYMEIARWMYHNKVEHFLLSSGSNGYTFQVRDNHWWFALKWAS